MPLIYYRSRPQYEVSIWKITEDLDFFSEGLKKNGFPVSDGLKIRHPFKRIQWFAARYLLDTMHPAAAIMSKGKKPMISHGPDISFSHSGNYAALLLSQHNSGLDIQVYDEKVLRVEKKFVNEEDKNTVQAADELKKLSLIWSIKEAVFKFYTTQLPFKNIIIVAHDPVKNEVDIKVERNGERRHHRLFADFQDELTLAYVIE